MDAKCSGCLKEFPATQLRVCESGGLYCFTGDKPLCNPKYAKQITVEHQFPWEEIVALVDYLNGDTSLDSLMAMDDLKENLQKKIYEVLKRVLKKDEAVSNGGEEVQQSDP
jgi:hypothetical protein